MGIFRNFRKNPGKPVEKFEEKWFWATLTQSLWGQRIQILRALPTFPSRPLPSQVATKACDRPSTSAISENTKMLTLSKEFNAQYADDRAENTDPRNLRLHVPILSADSSTITATVYCPAANNSWPTTDMITKVDLSRFIASNCLNIGSSVPNN